MTIYYETELYHYGVPGMKWGKRKYTNTDGSLNKLGKAKMAYKDAKKQQRKAYKEVRKAGRFAVGMDRIQKYESKKSAYNKSDLKTLSAKAEYNKLKSKNPNKAEFKTYKREMAKTGLPDSAADTSGRSKRIYNEIKKQKGKEYADKVAKRVQNEAIATFATSALVSVGMMATAAYLQTR